MTTSKPAASQASMASRVRRATPPSVPPVGEGRMKAWAWRDSSSMRVLSPRIEPPLTLEEGSTASTATLWPASTSSRPKRSTKVDLPTPGTPLIDRKSVGEVERVSVHVDSGGVRISKKKNKTTDYQYIIN